MKKLKKTKCIVSGCKKEVRVFKHGLCNAHAVRYYRTGSIGDLPLRKRRVLDKFTK